MNVILKIFLYLANYVPLYFLIYLKQLEINEEMKFFELFTDYKTLWVTLIIISGISVFATFYWLSGKRDYYKTFTDLHPINENVLTYFITYLIPLLSLDISNMYSVYINISLFLIIGIFHVKFNYLHVNIILILLGYRVYQETNTNNILITKKETTELTEDKIKVKQIGSSNYYIY